MLLESHLNTQIEQQSEIIMLQLLSETKLLFYIKTCLQLASFYDIQIQKTCKLLEIQYCSDYQFILSQNEKSIGVYDKKKEILRIYDMETNKFSKQFKKKFRFVGILNDQIVGIYKLSAIVISFDGTFVIKQLPKQLLKKPYHIQLAGNRLFVRRWKYIHVLTLNSAQGFEFKFKIEIRVNNKDKNIHVVKTGQNIYFMLGQTKGCYLYKNCNKFKQVTNRFLAFCFEYQKILSYNQTRVCMRIDGFPDYLCYRNLFNQSFQVKGFSDLNVLKGLDKFQNVATNSYIIIWYLNIIYVFDI